MLIETMKPEDYGDVAKIYQAGIETGVATFQTEVPNYEAWDAGHLSVGRFVARENGKIIGWAALSPVSSRCVYAGVAELSVYVASEARGKGVGKKLLAALIGEADAAGFWTLQAGIIKENVASIALHESCGFRVVGYRERLGQMPNGNWHDVVLVERRKG